MVANFTGTLGMNGLVRSGRKLRLRSFNVVVPRKKSSRGIKLSKASLKVYDFRQNNTKTREWPIFSM